MEKSSKGPDKKKLRFICGACGYKFTRFSKPLVCPYCGKGAVEADSSRGAEDLLAEIEDMEEDIKMRNEPKHR